MSTELLGIEHPVIQAPMAGAATPELAAAVSGAGGLGSLGSAVLAPDELIREAQAVREVTDRRFNVNFFCHQPPELDELDVARARERFGALYGELEPRRADRTTPAPPSRRRDARMTCGPTPRRPHRCMPRISAFYGIVTASN